LRAAFTPAVKALTKDLITYLVEGSYLADEKFAAAVDRGIVQNRMDLWNARMPAHDPERRLVLKALGDRDLVGFVCVLLDAEPSWGALFDNLHVKPGLKGQGIGYQLFRGHRSRCLHSYVLLLTLTAWLATYLPPVARPGWILSSSCAPSNVRPNLDTLLCV
jgi:GNAT superfamily N-acetyltransferase